MKNKFKIRYCKISELDKVIFLTVKAYAVPYRKNGLVNSFYETIDNINKDMERGLKILVVEEDNNLVGIVRFAPIGFKLKLGRLAVLPEYRNKGIGGILIDAVFKIAKKNNFKTVALDVMEEKGLIPYYEKFGFKVISKKKHQNHHDVLMEKRL